MCLDTYIYILFNKIQDFDFYKGETKMIYLDYAATTPISKNALQAYCESAKKFYGNTNSLHDEGTKAKEMMKMCQGELASYIQASKEEIYFTNGGSDSNLLAVRSILGSSPSSKNHIITSKLEHSSLLSLWDTLEEEGYEISYVSIREDGTINLENLRECITDATCLIAIQHVNHELGTVHPVKEIGEIAKMYNIPFHCDGVQSFLKLPINVRDMHITSLSIASHKIYGPKGIGALYLSKEISKVKQNGTIDVPSIVAFTVAAQEQKKILADTYNSHVNLRRELINHIPVSAEIISPPDALPSIVAMKMESLEGQYVMLWCNKYNIAISTGSACLVGQQEPSPYMIAMGKNVHESKQLFRISFGTSTTIKDIKAFTDCLKLLTTS